MNAKKIEVVQNFMSGNHEFLKITNEDDVNVLINIEKISTITQKQDGSIEVRVGNAEIVRLEGITISEITEALEDDDLNPMREY